MSDPRCQRRIHPLVSVQLAGSEEEMGAQHGRFVRELGGYEPTLDYYPRMPEIVLGRGQGELMRSVLRPAIAWALRRLERHRPPELLARSRAFAEALGRPELVRYLAVMDVLQNVVGIAGRFGLGPSRRLAARAATPSCSSLVVWDGASADGCLQHARNFDFPGAGLWEQRPVVVGCRPEAGMRYGFVTTLGAEAPVTSFNEAGLSLTAHTCFHRDVRFDGATVLDLCHDIIRRAESLADAERIARARPVASTWCLVISSARERSAAVLEVTGKRVEVVRPGPGEPFLANSNRYRSPALLPRQVAPAVGFIAHSDGRLRSLERTAREGIASGGLALPDLQALLASHRDAEAPGQRAAGGVVAQGISVKSVVVQPEARRVHVSLGDCPTGKGPYLEVPFAWDGEPGWRELPLDLDRLSAPPARWRYDQPEGQPAYAAFLEAVRLTGQGAHPDAVAEPVARAARLDPGEPTYRFLAGGFALRRDAPEEAWQEFRAGLAGERSAFRRGQLLLWASRAAAVAEGRDEQAAHHRAELLELDHPLLADYQDAARREQRRPLPRRRLRRLEVNLDFPDLVI